MATETSTSRSSSAADSYIGSLISLISKSEIRYEGILYNIDTNESSIGLKNVRSFGTEGRKKDGPQVPPSDNVYEYILFRGSDIKDLQVKSSPPAQPAVAINNDPAIIQSHYPRATLPSAVTGPSPDIGTQSAQMGLPNSNFQGSLPFYQPGATMSWGASSLPSANGSGLNMPMYWQGYYGAGAPNGLPHMHQQSLLQPPPVLAMPSMQQPMHYPVNANMSTGVLNLPEAPTTLVPATSSSISMNTSSLTPSPLPHGPSATVPFAISSFLPYKAPIFAPPTINPTTSKSSVVGSATLPYESAAQSASVGGKSDFVRTQDSSPVPTLPLVTPAQLLLSGSSRAPVSQSLLADHKDVGVIQVTSSPPQPKASSAVAREAQPPILPLPPTARTNYQPNGAPTPSHNHHGYRGRERGRGSGSLRAVTKFTEDFDFMAMNEKFNKDEVWGHLGKGKDTEGDPNISNEDADYYGYEEDHEVSKKHVYNKDDFFDSLSCDALNHEQQRNGRTRFSEQVKIDTETFGDISRQWGGRGPGRGGRGRGKYYYGGRGYGYGGRGYGRGQGTFYNRAP